MKHEHTNALINETSPYLLQHAHNPVDWHPWNEATLQKAETENKLLLISIGYAACHWCHVMEKESFEDSAVAKIMNDNFICIKVDREERPDIDQIYMTAVQLMNQRGGWPLNCVALPDGRPFWGGTYFQKKDWKEQLMALANAYQNDKLRVVEFADRLANGINQVEMIVKNTNKAQFNWKEVNDMVSAWSQHFDNNNGGSNGAPKFPMPNAYQFLLRYAHLSNNKAVEEHVKLTMDKMAYGGIYDQVGGGFARYSTDKYWKVPHFEKMLYDNGQLVSLYAEGYQKFQNPLYKNIVFETLEFVQRELTDESGAFYSSLDADSEAEEGKFYVWKETELQSLIADDFPIFKDYFNVNAKGIWEHENYILIRDLSNEEIAKKHHISLANLEIKMQEWKKILLAERTKRIRPGLDDKSLTSWNAIMLKAYVDAYLVFGEKPHLDMALKNAEFIVTHQMQKDGKLWHSYKNGKSTINGFLEDYALSIAAFVRLYEATYELKWLDHAALLTEYSLKHFYDAKSGMFFFTSDLDEKLVARKMEINDNVIPASNSVMANSLFDLGTILDREDYKAKSRQMLQNVQEDMTTFGSGYANYANLMMKIVHPYYEVAIVGKNAQEISREMHKAYHPNTLFLGSQQGSKLPLLEGKNVEGQTMIYVCENKVCQLPTNKVSEALKLLK